LTNKNSGESISKRGSKSPKPAQSRRAARNDRSSSASSTDSGTSGYATPIGYDSGSTDMDGIYPPLATLQYALHTVLAEKGEKEKKVADKMLKGDANKKLRESLKLERVKSAQIFATLFDADAIPPNCDIPQIKHFNRRKPPCSPEEFNRHSREISKNFPKYEGKCVELLYFLIELQALRCNLNITDEQLVNILRNRFSGRLRQYFMTELKREKNVVRVLNELSRIYTETVDVSAEVEKCANFKFQFKDIGNELVELKEIMSLAYPHLPINLFREAFILKVIDKLPSETRFEAVEFFEKQREREKIGFKPLHDHEITEKIIQLCKALELKQKNRAVRKVNYSETNLFDEDE
jgi:hypothetical protein